MSTRERQGAEKQKAGRNGKELGLWHAQPVLSPQPLLPYNSKSSALVFPWEGWVLGPQLEEEKNTPSCMTQAFPITHKLIACHPFPL